MAQRYRIRPLRTPTGPWDPDRRLEEALAERERFLERHPRYRDLQAEIDRVLDKAGSSNNRIAVLAMLMESKLFELQGELQRLNRILLSAARNR